jgi:hypothetical protein
MTNLNNILFDDKKYIQKVLLEFDEHAANKKLSEQEKELWLWRLCGRLECALFVVNVLQTHPWDSQKGTYLIHLKRIALEYLTT